MFGTLLHPTLELSLVLVVISTLFVAESAIITQASNKNECSACDVVAHGSMNNKFAIAMLVVSVLVLVYGLGFLGMHLYEKFM